MFSALEDLLFKFFNSYLRSDFLDMVLPLFESSLPVFLVAVISLGLFAVYCQKTYGEFFYRFLLFFGMLGLSAFFAHEGARSLFLERPRPYQEIAGTMYYDSKNDAWLQSQYPVDENYPPMDAREEYENSADSTSIAPVENSYSDIDEPLINDDIVSKDTEISNQELLENQNSSALETVSPKNTVYLLQGQQKLYPSSVIAISMAIAIVISLLVAKSMSFIYLFPVLIGWTQIYTGNAYVSDLILGWFVGGVAVFFSWLCFALFFRFAIRNS